LNSGTVLKKIFQRPESLKKEPFRYCPGCGHSLIHRLIAECIDALGIREHVIGIAPIGCAVFAYDYFNFDVIECSHGRPPAVATAMKRLMPDKIIFTYQGDGDLAAIGTTETIHAANRGEKFTTIFVSLLTPWFSKVALMKIGLFGAAWDGAIIPVTAISC